MSTEERAVGRLVDDATEFFLARRALEGEVYEEDERESIRLIAVATLAYLSAQAAHVGVEDDLNRCLARIAGAVAR